MVGNDTKRRKALCEDSAVKLRQNVGATSCATNDHEGTEVSRLGLTASFHLNSCVPCEHEVPRAAIEILNTTLITTNESISRAKTRLIDEFVNAAEISRAALKGASARSEQVCGRYCGVERWKEKCVLGDVEWQQWIDAMYEVVGAVARCALNGDSFCEKDEWCVLDPAFGFSYAEESFANVAMTSLDQISARVVWRDTNGVDVELCETLSESSREGWAIVVNDFSDCTPAANDVLKNKLRKGGGAVVTKRAVFRIAGE